MWWRSSQVWLLLAIGGSILIFFSFTKEWGVLGLLPAAPVGMIYGAGCAAFQERLWEGGR